jgi:hypothetical protein
MRKVVGAHRHQLVGQSLGEASLREILLLFSTDLVKLVMLAFAVAAPLAYLGVRRWLEGFAYHITLGPGVFFLAGMLVLVVAPATVSVHLRAATADPVESLRYEEPRSRQPPTRVALLRRVGSCAASMGVEPQREGQAYRNKATVTIPQGERHRSLSGGPCTEAGSSDARDAAWLKT